MAGQCFKTRGNRLGKPARFLGARTAPLGTRVGARARVRFDETPADPSTRDRAPLRARRKRVIPRPLYAPPRRTSIARICAPTEG